MYTKLVSPVHHTSCHCLFPSFLSCSFARKMLAASEFLFHPNYFYLRSFVPAAPSYWDFTHMFCIAGSFFCYCCCLNCLLKCDFITGYFQWFVFTIIYFFFPFIKWTLLGDRGDHANNWGYNWTMRRALWWQRPTSVVTWWAWGGRML